MRLSISAKPKEKNISYNYSDKRSELCLVNAFCVTVFVEGEIPYISYIMQELGELNVSDYPTQQTKSFQATTYFSL